MTTNLRSQGLPFSIIADECTDPHTTTEILSVMLAVCRFNIAQEPRIKECLFSFSHLERTNASAISQKILDSDPLVGLDPSKICEQAYDGAAVMTSNKAGVQAKIKDFCSFGFVHTLLFTLPQSISCLCMKNCRKLEIS